MNKRGSHGSMVFDVVSAGSWRTRAVVAGAVVLALTVLGVWYLQSRSDGVDAGPLEIKAGNTELVFPAPRDTTSWSAMAGGFLLCSPGPDVTVTRVLPMHGTGTEEFSAFTRSFTIHRRGTGLVGEPFIGGYGKPPWIGGVENPHQDRLVGHLQPAAGATLTPPRCEATSSAPGESAVELMVGLTAGRDGAAFDGVGVDYDSGGHHYRTQVDVQVTLCGTRVTDPDCKP